MLFNNQEKLKAITFSYGDGVTQDIRLIESLNKYGFKNTFIFGDIPMKWISAQIIGLN